MGDDESSSSTTTKTEPTSPAPKTNNTNSSNNNENTNSSNNNSNDNDTPQSDPVEGLDLSNSVIRTLSPSIGHFTNITILNLSNNMLVSLPEEIGKLINLQKLDVSNNKLTSLPRAIGRLHKLKELDIHLNNISELPTEMGRLVRLEKLHLDNNQITRPPLDVLSKGTRQTVYYLRDMMDATQAPRRRWHPKQSAHSDSPDQVEIKVMCWNVLAPSYATTQRYPHCPLWALEWSYRSERILTEVLESNADIICLQEVETEHYELFFQPELAKFGYQGIHHPKTRYKTMRDEDRRYVDGCCIFWKMTRFDLHSNQGVDFAAQAMARSDAFLKDHDAFNRLVTKDNIGLLVLLEVKMLKPPGVTHNGHFPSLNDARAAPQRKNESANSLTKYLLVCNTHIHWGPEFSDVKLMQTKLLIEEIQKVTPRNAKVPMIICGDFNSTPDSGVYQFLQNGHVPPTHTDFGERQWGNYNKDDDGKEGGECRHDLSLRSAYSTVMGKEPDFTNASFDFRGCLSYIWYSFNRVRVQSVLETISAEILEEDIAMPSTRFPSDHMSLVADFVLDDELGSLQQQQQQQRVNALHHPQQKVAPLQKPKTPL